MKKIFSFVLAAFALVMAGCDKDNKPGNGDEDVISVVGTWLYHADDDFETLTLEADNSYSHYMERFYKEEGTYAYSNNTLVLTPAKAWERDWVRDERYGGPLLDSTGNYQYTEWVEIEPRQSVVSCQVKFLYSGDVMMQKREAEYDDDGELWAPYVKENATRVSDVADIQGKWYWLSGATGTVPRVIVKVNGTNGEVIITPWEERYTGTIRYEKGVIYMDNPTFTTTRYEDDEGGWSHLNGDDPENSPWRTPFGENPYHGTFEGGFSLGFVADGGYAYGGIANLLAVFTKM